MKKILPVLIILLAVFFLFGQANPGDTNGITPNEIKVGSFQALSGPLASMGISVKKGMDSYFNWINSNGGIYGRKINLIVSDDAFNPSNTVIEVKKLVESDKVFALMCGLGAPGNLAIMDYVESQKVPYIYQAAGAGSLTIPPKRYIFGVQPNYTTEGAIAVKYLVEQKKAKRIAFVYRNADDGKEEYASVKKALAERKMPLVAEIPVEASATDFSTQIVKLMSSNVDSIIVMLFIPQSSNFVKQAKQLGLTSQNYLVSYPNADPTFAAIAGPAAVGVESLAWVSVDFADPKAHFIEVYQASFQSEIPNAYAVAGMIAAEIFTEGLKRAGKDLTREKLIAAMETFNGWVGKISPQITYGPISVKKDQARLGVVTMYVLKFKPDGTMEKVSDWIKL